MSNYRLENMECFGYREIGIAADLMRAYADGKAPDWFSDYGVTIEFNPNSGYVFLTNDDCEVLMLDGMDLVGWFFLSYAGNEGTAEDLWEAFEDGDIDDQDLEQLQQIFEMENMDDRAEAVYTRICNVECDAE